jgi:hypothetical protein
MDSFLIDARIYIVYGDLVIELDIGGYIFLIRNPRSGFTDINYN